MTTLRSVRGTQESVGSALALQLISSVTPTFCKRFGFSQLKRQTLCVIHNHFSKTLN